MRTPRHLDQSGHSRYAAEQVLCSECTQPALETRERVRPAEQGPNPASKGRLRLLLRRLSFDLIRNQVVAARARLLSLSSPADRSVY